MAFYRATFTLSSPPPPASGFLSPVSDPQSPIPSFRLRVGSLRKGQIWLNGRNVARFWQIGPQEDYKLPVSWLQERNELLIFAEEGGAEQVTILV